MKGGYKRSAVDNAHLLKQRFILSRRCLGEAVSACEQKNAALSEHQALRSGRVPQSSMGSPLGVQMAVAKAPDGNNTKENLCENFSPRIRQKNTGLPLAMSGTCLRSANYKVAKKITQPSGLA